MIPETKIYVAVIGLLLAVGLVAIVLLIGEIAREWKERTVISTIKITKPTGTETEQPVIYIAGPMTGHENFNRPAFFEAEAYLRSQGYQEIYNPAVAQHTLSYKTLIDLGLKALKGCNTIFMLHGWYQSRGARLEHLYALTVGLEIIYQDEIQQNKGEKS